MCLPCQCCFHRLAVSPHWRCCTDETLPTTSQSHKRRTSAFVLLPLDAFMRLDDTITTTMIERSWTNHSSLSPAFVQKEAADADAKYLRIGIMNLRHVVYHRAPWWFLFLLGWLLILSWNISYLRLHGPFFSSCCAKARLDILDRWAEL